MLTRSYLGRGGVGKFTSLHVPALGWGGTGGSCIWQGGVVPSLVETTRGWSKLEMSYSYWKLPHGRKEHRERKKPEKALPIRRRRWDVQRTICFLSFRSKMIYSEGLSTTGTRRFHSEGDSENGLERPRTKRTWNKEDVLLEWEIHSVVYFDILSFTIVRVGRRDDSSVSI